MGQHPSKTATVKPLTGALAKTVVERHQIEDILQTAVNLISQNKPFEDIEPVVTRLAYGPYKDDKDLVIEAFMILISHNIAHGDSRIGQMLDQLVEQKFYQPNSIVFFDYYCSDAATSYAEVFNKMAAANKNDGTWLYNSVRKDEPKILSKHSATYATPAKDLKSPKYEGIEFSFEAIQKRTNDIVRKITTSLDPSTTTSASEVTGLSDSAATERASGAASGCGAAADAVDRSDGRGGAGR